MVIAMMSDLHRAAIGSFAMTSRGSLCTVQRPPDLRLSLQLIGSRSVTFSAPAGHG